MAICDWWECDCAPATTTLVTSRSPHGKLVRWIGNRRKHREPDMHVQCSSVAARLHHTRPHVMVGIRGANQCPFNCIREMSGRTAFVVTLASTQRRPDESRRVGLQDRRWEDLDLALRSQQPLGLTITIGPSRHGQVPQLVTAPGGRDDGQFGICIAANWWYGSVAAPARDRAPLGAQDLSPSRNITSKPRPVSCTDQHDRDHRIAFDVADALECRSSLALRLLVDGDVKGALRNRKAQRHEVGNGLAIGRGKMPDPSRQQEPGFVV